MDRSLHNRKGQRNSTLLPRVGEVGWGLNTRATYAQAAPGLPMVAEYQHYYPFGMQLETLGYSSGFDLPNNYRYNGKELQTDYGLEWYDYGARFYDPQLGRWHSVDPLAEKAYSWTPYRYGLNNPISNIDIGGKFELINASKYPALTKLLQGAIQGILLDAKIMKNLQFYGNLNAATVKYDVKWGQGPKIWVRQLYTTGLYQAGKYPDRLQINSGFIAALENAARSGNVDQYRAEILEIIVNILHEYVHYGDFRDDGKYKDKDQPLENCLGYQFELATFGRKVFDTPDAKKVLDNFKSNNNQSNSSSGSSSNNSEGNSNNSSLINQILKLPPGRYKVVDGKIVPAK